MTLVEAAVETVEEAMRAEREGAGRLELCGDLNIGGVTPSLSLIRQVQARVRIPIVVMIRPRGGNFVYRDRELQQMLREIEAAAAAQVAGVVFGPLTAEGEVDRRQLARLVRVARPMEIVFHRAVDATRDMRSAVEQLVEQGVTRVLTSGGAPSVEAGLASIAELVQRHRLRIEILPGGGVRAGNAARIVRETGVSQIHVGLPIGAEEGRISEVVRVLPA